MIQLANHFKSDESRRHSEWLRQQQWFIKARTDQQRREKAEEKLDDDLLAAATEIVMATDAEIRAFTQRIDRYDEASVSALMENRIALEAVQERIEALLARAYVLEDGRRVFKTEDGSQVFDEFGAEVSGEELDPDAIGPNHPTWETFKAEKALEAEIAAERDAIIDYQAKLDDAREAASDGEMSAEDMEDLDAELLDLMPASVREHAGIEPAAPVPALKASFAIPSRDGAAPDTQNPAPASGTGQSFSPMPGG